MQPGGEKNAKESGSKKTRGGFSRLLSKGALLVLRFGVGIRKGLGRWGDVEDRIFEFAIGKFLGYEKDVNDSERDEELYSEVRASEHEYDIRILAV
jgi:hypothetical protein